MFPVIKTARPRLKEPTDEALREQRRLWQATRQVLEDNRQTLLAKPNNEVTINVLKVWRIREVPDFYGLYFLYFTASLPQADLNDMLAKEINDTLGSKSWWFIINRKKIQREIALTQLQNILQVLSAFDCMNNNRSDPQGEQHIKAILQGCQSLQEIKQAEENKYIQFSECIGKLRTLTYELINEIEGWRNFLSITNAPDIADRLNRIRIMFIDNDMNLLVWMLYDSGFVAQSFLKKWMNFVEKNDPFFIEILKEKPENRIQSLVLEGLRTVDNSDAVLRMVYKLAQEQSVKNMVLPYASNRSSRRASKESVTPREKIASPKRSQKKQAQQSKSEINIVSSKNKIEIIYSKKKKQPLLQPQKQEESKKEDETEVRHNRRPSSTIMQKQSSIAESEERDKVRTLQFRRLSIDKEKVERELERLKKQQQKEGQEREREQGKARDNDYRRLSVEKEKLERELERQRRKQQKQAQEFSKKFERLDRELEKFRDAQRLLRMEKKHLEEQSKIKNRPDRVVSSQDRSLNNDSVLKIYKRLGGSKGFIPTNGQDQTLADRNQRLERELNLQRKRQSKEVLDYERKLQEYDEELVKMKEERNQQRSRLKQIEREKEEKIRSKEQQLLTIKKYIKEELKSKPSDMSPYHSLDQYKSRNSSNGQNEQSGSEFEKEHMKQRLNVRRRIQDIYASNGSRRSKESSSRYNSLNRSESEYASNQPSARLQTIQIVYDKRNRELKTLAKSNGRQVKVLGRIALAPGHNRNHTIDEEQDQKVGQEKERPNVVDIYRKANKSLKELEKKKMENKQEKKRRERELEKQKKELASEYESKLSLQRSRYKSEMEALSATLKIREMQLLHEIKGQLEEQKQLRRQNEKKLAKQKQARIQIEKEKMLLEQERQRLALEIETKRLKQQLQGEIREELLMLNDIKKEEEEAQNERKLREESIRQQIEMLEQLRNQEIARLDDQNDHLRKVLLSRKKCLNKIRTEQSEILKNDEVDRRRTQKLRTEPFEPSTALNNQVGRPNSAAFKNKDYSVVLSNERYNTSHMRTETIHTQSLLAELQDKADIQQVMTQQLFARFKATERSNDMKDRDEVELLVKKYRQTESELKPRTSSPSLEKRHQTKKSDQFLAAAITNKSKKEIIQELLNNRRERQKFEKELEAKGTHIRPTLTKEAANELYFKNFMDLRLQSEMNTLGDFRDQHRAALNMADEYCKDELETDNQPAPAPRTIRQHILAHQKQIDDQAKKASEKKNFLKLNKTKLKGPNLQVQQEKPHKPVKISEQVMRRQEEALKKYVNRSKGKPQKDQKEPKQPWKKKQGEKESKVVVVEKLNETITFPNKDKSAVGENQLNISKESPEKAKDSQQNQSSLSKKEGKPPSRMSQTHKGLEIDLSRIPTENSHKQRTEPIEEYKQQEEYHQMMDQYEKRAAEQRKQEQMRLSQEQQQEQRKKYEQQLNRLKTEEIERLRQQKIVKYRGIINEMLQLSNYSVYQEVIDQSHLKKYLEDYERMSSADLQKINKFNITQALQFCEKEVSYHILIAKDAKQLEKGIGLFRKDGAAYLCDHLTTHQINTLSEVALSISRQIFLWDAGCERIEFYLHFDQADLEHAHIYQSFEQLCIDYGEVYQVRGDTLKRKYVVKRTLFLEQKKVGSSLPEHNNMAIGFLAELFIGDKDTLKPKEAADHKQYEKQGGSIHDGSPYEIAVQLLLTEQIKNVLSLPEFEGLKQKIKSNLRLKELMLTTVLMEKKGLSVEEFTKQKFTKGKEVAEIQPQLFEEVQPITYPLHYCSFHQSFPLTAKLKICRLTIEEDPISYIGVTVGAPTITATCSNYNTQSYFLTLSPKHKMLLMDASEFLALTQTSPEIDLFFYLKHYIKNITDFVKEEYPVVYIPRVDTHASFQHREMREVLERSLFTLDQVHFGDHRMPSSIRMEPSYKDLVIKPPFLLCVLSGKLERASSGTPLYARLVTVNDIM